MQIYSTTTCSPAFWANPFLLPLLLKKAISKTLTAALRTGRLSWFPHGGQGGVAQSHMSVAKSLFYTTHSSTGGIDSGKEKMEHTPEAPPFNSWFSSRILTVSSAVDSASDTTAHPIQSHPIPPGSFPQTWDF